MKKRICIFTSTRADFGILRPLVEELLASAQFEVGLFVTGTHLSSAHGQTVQEIEAAKFPIAHRVSFSEAFDAQNHSLSMGQSLLAFAKELAQGPQYDLAFILGDRFEALAFGLACYNRHLPVAHIHGGEVTTGALDEAYRHALTKLSVLHFPCAEVYAQRIIRMGESPARVHNVGALAIDNIEKMPRVSKAEIEKLLGKKLSEKVFLMTFHPETNSPDFGLAKLENIISALKNNEYKDVSVLLTGTNQDQGSDKIKSRLLKWAQEDSRIAYIESLGAKNYFSAARISQLVLGNSSSGILEMPSLGVPTVNVGTRQEGRLRAPSVIDVKGSSESEIAEVLQKAINMNEQQRQAGKNLYGHGGSAKKIVKALETTNFENLSAKEFYDGP